MENLTEEAKRMIARVIEAKKIPENEIMARARKIAKFENDPEMKINYIAEGSQYNLEDSIELTNLLDGGTSLACLKRGLEVGIYGAKQKQILKLGESILIKLKDIDEVFLAVLKNNDFLQVRDLSIKELQAIDESLDAKDIGEFINKLAKTENTIEAVVNGTN